MGHAYDIPFHYAYDTPFHYDMTPHLTMHMTPHSIMHMTPCFTMHIGLTMGTVNTAVYCTQPAYSRIPTVCAGSSHGRWSIPQPAQTGFITIWACYHIRRGPGSQRKAPCGHPDGLPKLGVGPARLLEENSDRWKAIWGKYHV